ncbi:MAG: TasA family protein [Bacillota bacterium]|nr:TasA family protein [Bacillota bacterium]
MKKKLTLVVTSVLLVAALVIGGTLAYFTDSADQVNTFTVGNVKIKLDETKAGNTQVSDMDRTEADQTYTEAMAPGKSFVKDPKITIKDGSQDAYVFLKIEMNKYVSLVNLMGVDAYKNNIGGLRGEYPGFTAFMTNLASDANLRAAVVDRWFTGINHADWKVMNQDEITAAVTGAAGQTNPNQLSVVLGYIGSDDDTLSAGDSVTFMTAFGMPSTVTSSMFDGEDAYYINGVSKSNFNTKEATFKMTFTAYAIQKAELANIDAAYTAMFPTSTTTTTE